jgi:DNA-binding transcriptional LysR family regulator
MGLAYITERAVREDLAAGRLIRVMMDWTPPFAGVCLYYPRQSLPSAGLKAFIEFFRAGRGSRTV